MPRAAGDREEDSPGMRLLVKETEKRWALTRRRAGLRQKQNHQEKHPLFLLLIAFNYLFFY